MNRHPPAHHITMRHHDARDIAIQSSIIKLAEVKKIRPAFLNNRLQVLGRSLHVGLRIQHPFQLKRGGPIIEISQSVHPASLGGGGDIAKADERYPITTPYQPRY